MQFAKQATQQHAMPHCARHNNTGLVGRDCLVNTDDCKKRRKKHLLYFISVHPHIYNKIKSNECREKNIHFHVYSISAGPNY